MPGPITKCGSFTHYGISVYNPTTGKFNNDLTSQLLAYKVYFNGISSIVKDSNGNFWFLTVKRGIYCYDPVTKATTFYNRMPKSKIKLYSSYVSDAVPGQNNVLWLIYNDGVIDKLDTRTNQVLQRSFALYNANKGKGKSYSGILDNRENLWIHVTEDPIGVFNYNTATNALQHFFKGSPGISLNSNIINNTVQGDNNTIWIGTDHGGINLINMATNTLAIYSTAPTIKNLYPVIQLLYTRIIQVLYGTAHLSRV